MFVFSFSIISFIMARIIAISGHMGSGKSTAAQYFKEFLPEYKVVSFASRLKEAVSILLGLPLETFYTPEGKNLTIDSLGITVRQFMQKFGTEAIQSTFGSDFWVNLLLKDFGEDSKIIIDDLRFEHEIQGILKRCNNSILIRINRDNKTSSHVSESELDNYSKFTYVYDNNDSPEDLRLFVKSVICTFNT